MSGPIPPGVIQTVQKGEVPSAALVHLYGGSAAGAGVWQTDPADMATDASGNQMAYPRFGFKFAPNRSNGTATSFWNAFAAGAGALSPAVQTFGQWGKARVYVQSALANTFNVQFSLDNVTWFTLTQDNAGTPFIIATTATQLTSVRDLPGCPGQYVRLKVITADTVSAGIEENGV